MYSDLEELKKLIPERDIIELTDDDSSGIVNENAVSEAIDQADKLIDAYLSVQYQVPLSPVPEIIRNISAQLAIANLFARRSIENPVWEEKRKVCIQLLDKIRKGEIGIGVSNNRPVCNVKLKSSEKMFSNALGEF